MVPEVYLKPCQTSTWSFSTKIVKDFWKNYFHKEAPPAMSNKVISTFLSSLLFSKIAL